MKTISFLLCLSLNFSIFSSENNLVKLNKYWKGVPENEKIASSITVADDKSLIQFHLNFVIDSLSRVELKDYNDNQIKNRQKLLKVLKTYSNDGVFPKNTYHSKRTPYFIDDFGTACAVGYLIIHSGHSGLAKRISQESNYDYLEDMNFPEIELWAKDYGFTLNELMWIQPGYGPPCAKDTAIASNCPNGVGCLNPDFYKSSLDSASLILEVMERNIGNGWFPDTNFFWYYYQGFWPYGYYRFCLVDSLNNRDTLYYDIMGPTPFVFEDSIIQTSNNCLNSIQLSGQNGQPPYLFRLLRHSNAQWYISTTGFFDSLCPGMYDALLIDSNYCSVSMQVSLGGVSSISEEIESRKMLLIKNPAVNNYIELSTILSGHKYLKIFNLSGQLVFTHEFSQETLSIPVALKNGVYLLKITNGKDVLSKKIILQN